MFTFCSDPGTLSDLAWMACYLTTAKHSALYWSIGTVLTLLALAAPAALVMGFLGATAARSRIRPLSWLGKGYILIVRGVPDIVFFLFFVIAFDQLFEYIRHRLRCPDWNEPVRQGANFIVCAEAKLPLSSAPQIWHDVYGFLLAALTFAIVFGAFAANVLAGAMRAVPHTQIETAEAYGLSRGQTFRRIIVPQMWVHALPGLSNLWMLLIKATPLLFLLGVQDIVYWARELGATATPNRTAYPHGDWRLWYFLFLLAFYLTLTKVSELALDRLMARLTRGQPTLAGEAARREVTA